MKENTPKEEEIKAHLENAIVATFFEGKKNGKAKAIVNYAYNFLSRNLPDSEPTENKKTDDPKRDYSRDEAVTEKILKLLKGEEESSWISAETPPVAFRKVLVAFEKESKGLKAVIKTGQFTGNGWGADGGVPILTNQVTHWQPLPEPPKK